MLVQGQSPFPADVLQKARARNPGDPLRVMVVHSSHTGGHRSAAESLVEALSELPNVEAESFNTLDDASNIVKGAQKGFYNLVSDHFPKLRRWGFELAIRGSFLPWWIGTAALGLKAWASPEAAEYINSRQPDVIVSTHSQTNAMLSHWKGSGTITAPVHSVPTDFLAHRMWAQEHIDHYYVATPGVKEDLERFGVDSSQVSVTGIPIKPKYAVTFSEDQRAVRERLGLDPDLPTVVIAGGSLGLQPFEKLVKALDERPYPMQVVCVCAKNDQARQTLGGLTTTHPLTTLGFVDNMEDWLRASDVIITKPGGLTSSEILALGKPMIIANPQPGMEEHQSERLAKTGAVFPVADASEAAAQAEKLMTDAALRAQVATSVATFGKGNSAYTVAAQIIRAC